MELPETIRRRLEDFSRNVLFDQTGTQPFTKENGTFLPHGKKIQNANVMGKLALMLTLLESNKNGWI